MLSHVTLHVSDIAKSKEFYAKTLEPLGYKVAMEFPEWNVVGFISGEGNRDFWLNGDGCKQQTHVAFAAQSEAQTKAFWDAALSAGGRDNGKPGYRTDYGAGYYAAFAYDPDGHNIEAMWWDASKAQG